MMDCDRGEMIDIIFINKCKKTKKTTASLKINKEHLVSFCILSIILGWLIFGLFPI
jgi:hypothetical protein